MNLFHLLLLSLLQASADKRLKQGMRLHRPGLEFRMELTTKEPRMVSQLDNFNQIGFRVNS